MSIDPKKNKGAIAGLVMVGIVAAAQLAVPRIAVGTSKKLPVTAFPRSLGDWTAGDDRPVDPELKSRLAGATIVERIYNKKHGGAVDLLLLTSDTLEDFHDPTICYPSQGWKIRDQQSASVGGFPVMSMTARNGLREVKTVYWFVGDYASYNARTPLQKKLYKLRHIVVRKEEGTCLFVRIIAPANPEGQAALNEFMTTFRPSILGLYANDPSLTPKRLAL